MTLCPISFTVGCQKCLFFNLCPLKSFLGNFKKRVKDRRSSEMKSDYTGEERRLLEDRRLFYR